VPLAAFSIILSLTLIATFLYFSISFLILAVEYLPQFLHRYYLK